MSTLLRRSGFSVGLIAMIITILAPPPTGLSGSAWAVVGLAVAMACWWLSEALPLAVTALLPIVYLPARGLAAPTEAAAPYADPLIFLFLGGFILSASIQRWGLHQRIGLAMVNRIGKTPRRLVGGILVTTALTSMWVSNSASAMMMLPVALAILAAAASDMSPQERASLGVALTLAVAYGATIGGLSTLIGSPPNALLAAYMARTHGVEISFAQWLAIGTPLAAVMLLSAWGVLILAFQVPARASGQSDFSPPRLPPISQAEIRVALIVGLTAAGWVSRPFWGQWLPGIDDGTLAILAALMLFVVPAGSGLRPILVWDDVKAIPWDVLLLFGGGLSLASAIAGSGLSTWIAEALQSLSNWPLLVVVSAATAIMILLTELTSNTASAATLVPIGGAVAVSMGADPIVLALPLALAASCGFMMPVGTPPNAIAYASGQVTVQQMAWAGLWLNLIGVVAITGLTVLTF